MGSVLEIETSGLRWSERILEQDRLEHCRIGKSDRLPLEMTTLCWKKPETKILMLRLTLKDFDLGVEKCRLTTVFDLVKHWESKPFLRFLLFEIINYNKFIIVLPLTILQQLSVASAYQNSS